MINPPIFSILNASSAVKAKLGTSPLRVYAWERAPANTKRPYIVYGLYNGSPENYLDKRPDIDNKGVQLELYTDTSQSADECFGLIRDALETHAYMTNFSTIEKDPETDYFVTRMEFDFWEAR